MRNVKAVMWLIISVTFGSLNDLFSKQVCDHLSTYEVAFWRYFFAIVTILPFMFFDFKLFKTEHLKLHCFRGFSFFLATIFWVIGLKNTNLVSAAIVGFATPFFVIILSYFFLKEKVTLLYLLTALISFISIVFTIDFNNFSIGSGSLVLLFSCIFFALSDFLNKKYVKVESDITMVFYFNLFAFFFSFCCCCCFRKFTIPSLGVLHNMFLLGVSANFLLYFLLKAFTLADAAFLSPFKFFEFFTSAIFGYIFFNEIPDKKQYFAMVIILACNIFLLKKEQKVVHKFSSLRRRQKIKKIKN